MKEEGLRRKKPTHSGFLKWSVVNHFECICWCFFVCVWVSRIMKMFIAIKAVLGGSIEGCGATLSTVTYCPDHSMSNWVLVTS